MCDRNRPIQPIQCPGTSIWIVQMPYAVSKAEFGRLVERALEELPKPFAEHIEEVAIEVRSRPNLKDIDRRPGELLLGLYRGRPRTERSVQDNLVLPDVIYIFQENIERVSRSEADLVRQIRTTVLHEIGHHFGMSEQDLDDLGYG